MYFYEYKAFWQTYGGSPAPHLSRPGIFSASHYDMVSTLNL
ncbi:hypothetical protein SAMN04487963_0075 [Marinobacter zhejiangensis]|uniref:Uncharacterized protein n=1 Tax=Marinobacter zhejiangensis TaxID=488535 RepID=A0A1I4KUD9_9GAMM|nr:hypothetical protein SAMN04487963_0075 [Marinobacter zhejiangensis]